LVAAKDTMGQFGCGLDPVLADDDDFADMAGDSARSSGPAGGEILRTLR
jgi:hypothetical protein